VDHGDEREPRAAAWSVAGVVLAALLAWAALGLALVSFGPGTWWVTVPVMVLGGVGWALNPGSPVPERTRRPLASAVAVVAVALGLLVAALTPPSAGELATELDAIGRELGVSGPWSEGLAAPWEATPAHLSGTVRAGVDPLEITVAALQGRGYRVVVLRREANGLDPQHLGQLWDLRASKARFEVRARFSDHAVWATLAWRSVLPVQRPFATDGLEGFVLRMLATGAGYWFAVVTSFVAALVLVVSVALTVWWARRAARGRGAVDRGGSAPPVGRG
jgi:hypothetical protein